MLRGEPIMDRLLVQKAGHVVDFTPRTVALYLPTAQGRLLSFEDYIFVYHQRSSAPVIRSNQGGNDNSRLEGRCWLRDFRLGSFASVSRPPQNSDAESGASYDPGRQQKARRLRHQSVCCLFHNALKNVRLIQLTDSRTPRIYRGAPVFLRTFSRDSMPP